MPLPQRRKNEDKQTFIARCMSDDKVKKEFPQSAQRLAVCVSNSTASCSLLEGLNDTYEYINIGYTEVLTAENYIIPEDNWYEDFGEVIEHIDLAIAKPGLWENIRKKKEREGKKYRPAKPGDKDRPSKEAWKRAQSTKEYKYRNPKTGEVYTYDRPGPHKKDGVYLIKATEYRGRKVTLNKPFRTPDGPKKFSVYVKNDKDNVVKVNFGDPNMDIKRDDPNRRKNFRARHNCENPGPKWKARYWSCKFWSKPKVSDLV